MQGVVDVVLKGGRSIAKAKGHNERLEQAKARDEGGFHSWPSAMWSLLKVAMMSNFV